MNNKLKNGKLPFIVLSAITFISMFIPHWFKSKVFADVFHSLIGVIFYLGKAIVTKLATGVDSIVALAKNGGQTMAQYANLDASQTTKFLEKLDDNTTFEKIMKSLSSAQVVVFIVLVFLVVFFLYWNIKAIKAMLKNNVFAVDYAKTAGISSIVLGLGYLVVYAFSFVATYVNYNAGLSKITRIFAKTLKLDTGLFASSFTLTGIIPLVVIAIGIAQVIIVKKHRVWTREEIEKVSK